MSYFSQTRTRPLLAFALFLVWAGCADEPNEGSEEEWISLFNGHDLSDWIVEINHHEVGVNHGNTFRVEDGILKDLSRR